MFNTNLILFFFLGTLFGLFLCYIYLFYLKKKDYSKPIIKHKDFINDSNTIKNCLNILSEKNKPSLLPNNSSLIMNIENEDKNDYYEVSIYDKKDNLLWVNSNISQIDLSQFNDKDLKYKIFNPSNKNIGCNIFEVPKLQTSFNTKSIKENKLKKITETEKDYQEAVINKILSDHNLFNIKYILNGIEIKKNYEGIISKKSKIYFDNTFNFFIKGGFNRIFLIYPSTGILVEEKNIEIKNNIHENFNLKFDEVIIKDNDNCDYSICCITPNIAFDSEIFLFQMIFV